MGDTSTLYGRQQKKVPNYSAWKQEIALSPARRPSHIPPDNLSEAFYIRLLYSCLVDADYLDTEAFMDGTLPRGGYEPIASLLDKLNQYIAPWWNPQNELNRKRCDILRSCLNAGENFPNGLYTLTVPTGGGKTVSSLAFALRHAATHGKSGSSTSSPTPRSSTRRRRCSKTSWKPKMCWNTTPGWTTPCRKRRSTLPSTARR